MPRPRLTHKQKMKRAIEELNDDLEWFYGLLQRRRSANCDAEFHEVQVDILLLRCCNAEYAAELSSQANDNENWANLTIIQMFQLITDFNNERYVHAEMEQNIQMRTENIIGRIQENPHLYVKHDDVVNEHSVLLEAENAEFTTGFKLWKQMIITAKDTCKTLIINKDQEFEQLLATIDDWRSFRKELYNKYVDNFVDNEILQKEFESLYEETVEAGIELDDYSFC